MTGRFTHQERSDLDAIPQTKLAHACAISDTITAGTPCKRARLPIYCDRAEVAPIVFTHRRRQRFRVRAPIGEQVECDNTLAFGFGGAAA